MIQIKYLITLLELYNYRSARVWEEIESLVLNNTKESDFQTLLASTIKDKRKNIHFNNSEINLAIEKADKTIEYCSSNKIPISIISFEDEDYPSEKMMQIPIGDRPIILYAMGNTKLLKMSSVAIIGSRNTDTKYFNHGLELSKNISKNYVVISGLALGSDTAAHSGAVPNGRTIAILANGLNTVYPKENRELANEIYKNGGLILSEYPPLSKTQRYYFAQRDRIQAALAKAIIVIETGLKSGTMITIDYARKYNKKIIVLEPFSGDKYNDDGNKKLLLEADVNALSNDKIKAEDLLSMIENEPKYFRFKIVDKANFKMYKLDNKEYTRIPKKYKEISRDNDFVITELIDND